MLNRKTILIGAIVAAIAVVVIVLLAVFLTLDDEQENAQTTTTPWPITTDPPLPQEQQLEFPTDFHFGSSSSAYQIEGAWDTDGKGESIWDRLTHSRPELIADNSNGDVSANSYYRYKDDVQALKATGADFYKFSISWSRVLPDGDISSKNEPGLQYYDKLIDELLANGIEPMVTMFHWDLPQRLQELGGWTNSYIVQYFEQYALLLFDRYADRVKYWITINEPSLFCLHGYSTMTWAPMVNASGIGEYLCAHHILLSNARAYHLYRKNYFERFGGKLGISLHSNMYIAKSNASPADVAAAERSMQFLLGWFGHPILSVTGDYPAIMKSILSENSHKENRRKSRLPAFTAAEMNLIKGTVDFIGVSYYNSYLVQPATETSINWAGNPSYYRDEYTLQTSNSGETEGLRKLLNWISKEYNNPEVIVTESGVNDGLDEIDRINLVKSHLKSIHKAKLVDGCRISGVTHSSLVDSFEWTNGYTKKLGLFHIDLNEMILRRTAKQSAYVYKQLTDTRQIPVHLAAIPAPPDAVFADGFLFGCSSSSYQIEGAWNRDGKGENIWDRLTHSQPEIILDRSNGDVAANSYDFYREDVKALKQIGVNFYRFSISWARILPDGDVSSLNEAGLQYYDNLINELLANGIQPMVTMFHWDLPQSLQELGGYANRYMIDYFEQYAKVLFDRYADRVKFWITFNEPSLFCTSGYNNGNAPHLMSPGIGVYLCNHYILLSHARAFHLYQNHYARFGGKIGISVHCVHSWPKDATFSLDIEAAERANQFELGIIAHPIFSRTGGYPKIVKTSIDENSKNENRKKSRLPQFTAQEIASIRGSADFIGLNFYTSSYATPGTEDRRPNPSFARDKNIISSINTSWPVAASYWLRSFPAGLRALLNWIKSEYDNPEVIITENGWSDRGDLNDVERIDYLKGHLQAVLDARTVDNCNVTGYAHWSLIDNFEWSMGYTENFGLFHIDFASESKTRTAKSSVAAYSDIIETRRISSNYPPAVQKSQRICV